MTLMTGTSWAQRLTIDDCYKAARTNYPAVQQYGLIEHSAEYSLQNARCAYLPQIAINGQASYQSDVTRIPIEIPGYDIPQLSKDQYKIYAELNYSLTGLLTNGSQIRQSQLDAEIQKGQLDVDLYALRERVYTLYFGILMSDAQLEQTRLVAAELEQEIKTLTVSARNGVVTEGTVDNLRAELLKLHQRQMEATATRKGYMQMLGLFMGSPIDEQVALEKPSLPSIDLAEHAVALRPESTLFSLQEQQLDLKLKQLSQSYLPQLSLFAQCGYGQPALNILHDGFDTYYIAGARLSWNLTGFYTDKGNRLLIEDQRSKIQNSKEAFDFNSQMQLYQKNAEIEKLQQLMADDDKIIALRERVKNITKTQLDNGTATSTDYLSALNAEDQARQDKSLHEIQLLLAVYSQRIITGK